MAEPPSYAALERADQSIAAMASLGMDASAIAEECGRIPTEWSVLAVVDLELRTAIYGVPTAALSTVQPQLEGAGWSLVLARGTPEGGVMEVLQRVSRLARSRREVLERLLVRAELPPG